MRVLRLGKCAPAICKFAGRVGTQTPEETSPAQATVGVYADQNAQDSRREKKVTWCGPQAKDLVP